VRPKATDCPIDRMFGGAPAVLCVIEGKLARCAVDGAELAYPYSDETQASPLQTQGGKQLRSDAIDLLADVSGVGHGAGSGDRREIRETDGEGHCPALDAAVAHATGYAFGQSKELTANEHRIIDVTGERVLPAYGVLSRG
jgi:hypothetical protein